MSTHGQETALRWTSEPNGKHAAGQRGVHVRRIEIDTTKRVEIRDLTAMVEEMVAATGVNAGLVTLSTMHTTTAVFVNEPQTALLEDIEQLLERIAPRGEEWKHNDPRYSDCDRHNADAHLRAIVLGNGVTLQVADGTMTMGQWQRILMAELDGPRKRTLVLQVLAFD